MISVEILLSSILTALPLGAPSMMSLFVRMYSNTTRVALMTGAYFWPPFDTGQRTGVPFVMLNIPSSFF